MSKQQKTPIQCAPVAEGARFTMGSATAFAVRREEKDIALRIRRERRPLQQAMSRTPFVRGMQRLIRATFGLIDGISESAELYPQRVSRGNRLERGAGELFQFHPESLVGLLSGLAIPVLLLGLIWGLPLAVERLLLSNLALARRWTNGIMCAIRILCAWLALFLCGRLRVVKRLCMYRGAINKVLNAYEDYHRAPTLDEALDAEHIYHRSDAAFLMVVLALSFVAFACIRTFTLPVQLLVRVLTVFAVAGIINEPIQALEHLRLTHPLSALLAPYRGLERLFVMEPNDQMVEVALCAFNAARENDL